MKLFLDPETGTAFLTLLALEIVLGIDNVIFISILVDRLPEVEAGPLLGVWDSEWRWSCASCCSCP